MRFFLRQSVRAVLLLSLSNPLWADGRGVDPVIDGYVFQVLRAYNTGGLTALKAEINNCYRTPTEAPLDCARLDLAAQKLEQTMAAKYNFRREPFFSDEQVRPRTRVALTTDDAFQRDQQSLHAALARYVH